MEHYLCKTICELPGYMQTLFRVPEGMILNAGRIYVAENLDKDIYGNLNVFVPEIIEDVSSQIPIIILNNSFETIPDNRRPDGNPDYTVYDYIPGDIITGIKLLPETRFEISTDAVIAETDIKIGGYLVPEEGSSKLIYEDNLEDINIGVCLVIEDFKDFRIGGQFGDNSVPSLVVRAKKNCLKQENGLKITYEVTDNLEIPVNENTTIATLTTTGGTSPYGYSFVNGGLENNNFKIEGNIIKAKENLTVSKIYHMAIKSTDNEGKTKSTMINVFIDNPSIKSINITMTDDIREGESSTQPGGLIAVAEVEGGTPPYTLSLSGESADRFITELMSVKTGKTTLTEGIYNVVLTATDSKEKTINYNLEVSVQHPYPEIDSVTLNLSENLTAPVLANTTVGQIQVIGGTSPYQITLPEGVGDNDLFIIEDSIKAKNDITIPGQKNITVLVTDKHNKTKTTSGVLSLGAPEITAVNFSQTEGLREGETNVNPNAIIGTLSVTGGTAPIAYSIAGGKDATLFKTSGNTLRVKDTALTQGNYEVTVSASDNYGKTNSDEVGITILAPYSPISNVAVKPLTGLKIPVASNTKVADITSTNGKPPISYSLPAGVSNNDSFQISGTTVLSKGEITQAGSYALVVRGTDANGNTKDSVTTAFTIAES